MCRKNQILELSIAKGIYLELYSMKGCEEVFTHDAEKEDWTFRLDYCFNGRLEAEFKKKIFGYIESGEFAINTNKHLMLHSRFTQGIYEGLSIIINDQEMDEGHRETLKFFSIDLEDLNSKVDYNIAWHTQRAVGKLEQNLMDLMHLKEGADPKWIWMNILQILYLVRMLIEEKIQEFSYFSGERISLMKELVFSYLEKGALHWNLQTIIQESGFSEKYFYRLFKNIYGDTPGSYSKKYFLNLAATQLAMTDRSIQDIAMESGYANFSKFSSAFKKIYNKTPSEYRKSRQEMEHYR